MTSALDESEWSASCPGHFTLGEECLLDRRLGGPQSWPGYFAGNRTPTQSLLLYWLSCGSNLHLISLASWTSIVFVSMDLWKYIHSPIALVIGKKWDKNLAWTKPIHVIGKLTILLHFLSLHEQLSYLRLTAYMISFQGRELDGWMDTENFACTHTHTHTHTHTKFSYIWNEGCHTLTQVPYLVPRFCGTVITDAVYIHMIIHYFVKPSLFVLDTVCWGAPPPPPGGRGGGGEKNNYKNKLI
jgi:hypothetical protein